MTYFNLDYLEIYLHITNMSLCNMLSIFFKINFATLIRNDITLIC